MAASQSFTLLNSSTQFLNAPLRRNPPPFLFHPSSSSRKFPTQFVVSSRKNKEEAAPLLSSKTKTQQKGVEGARELEDLEEEEVEEELPWIEEKAADLVEFTGTVMQAIPGPRVGKSSLPWLLAVPLAYVGISFVFTLGKTVRKLNSPKEKKRRIVNKNAMLCKSVDDLFQQGRDTVNHSELKDIMKQTDFTMEEVLRKYIRYALTVKPFDPDVVSDLIHLRKVSMLGDGQVAEVLNEISRRIVKEKGPVVMDVSGFTEKGAQRKLAVQGLFGRIFYLAELHEFCSRDNSLTVKEIFGVTDEDADILRIHTLSETGDMDSLQKMMGDSDTEVTSDPSSPPSDSI